MLILSSNVYHLTFGDWGLDENGNPIIDKDSLFNNTHYYVGNGKHFIKLKALDRKIFLKEGKLYRLDDVDKTRVQLGSLSDVNQTISNGGP